MSTWVEQLAQTLSSLDASIAGERKTGVLVIEIHVHTGHVNVFKVKDASPTIVECRLNGTALTAVVESSAK